MTGERREFPRIGGLVERKDDDVEIALVAEPVEQRLQGAHVFGRRGNVAALVLAEGAVDPRIVVAHRAGVDLHDEPVDDAHARHLGQHLRAEEFGVRLVRRAGLDAVEERGGGGRLEIGGRRGRMAVGRGRPAHLDEVAPAIDERFEITRPGRGVASREAAELGEIAGEVRILRIDHRIGPEGRDDASLPAALADLAVMAQVVERALGGADHLDVEALEEGARAEGRRLEGTATVSSRSAFSAEGCSSMPNTVVKAWFSHSHEGVPR